MNTTSLHRTEYSAGMAHILHKFLFLYVLLCLGKNALGSGIVNGKKAKEKSMLYMASVQNNRGHICGGFLVSKEFVVTAAHCDDRNPSSVVIGTHNLKKIDNDTMRYGIKKCKHPLYVNIISGNDIMLLKLSRKAQLGKRVKVIQLPSPKFKLKENQKCHVAGWGSTRTRGEVVDELLEADVPVTGLEKCQKAWHNILPANVVCAGGYDTNNGICQGDSGGPLVCKEKYAVGVVSFNNNNTCKYPDIPNVYTDISKFLPWIKKIIKNKKC
ncbi:granzyme B-like [Mastacembelus armatus]|uniref:Granzyme B-like n=1 Tax=Mastacembelus armatus TaxID=205130 RepID=A0A3Q3SQF8_9TELE|nr:granzyme B-like [Mastacembelus armatus]